MSDIINRWDKVELEDQLDLILEKKWDVLIILDDCRYDMFKKVNTIKGSLKKVRSAGYNSCSFIQNVFEKHDFSDTVCVMGNPFISKYGHNFKHIRHSYLEDWIEDPGTVCPKMLSENLTRLQREYKGSKLIAWYMQPHQPFLVDCVPDVERFLVGKTKNAYGKTVIEDNIFSAVQNGLVPKETFAKCFEMNLEYVLTYLESDVLSDLDGKIIITSDHGEYLGENGLYGHPHAGFDNSEILRSVPWFEVKL